ncbi:WAP-type 'four-disulfide core [Teladorsagia circumcincta]|uniref:WAP-type 'four-disulfide core n=1 Tax=Teladorsagia circumcincta TaxID=45464 RepID=A0A2G9US93_TELCI|nr:WAP-type 'four-disulfide core [Teladorsagia circumcincta]
MLDWGERLMGSNPGIMPMVPCAIAPYQPKAFLQHPLLRIHLPSNQKKTTQRASVETCVKVYGLLNPCPVGQPMTLQNGVTALCATSDQCTHDYWCHKDVSVDKVVVMHLCDHEIDSFLGLAHYIHVPLRIGYNGLGFCCAAPEVPSRRGEPCPAVMPLKSARCSSKCTTDYDCGEGKCCFDGCGLSCHSSEAPKIHRVIVPQRRNHHFQPGDVAKHNKGVLSSVVADCPSSVERSLVEKFTNCSTSCESDDDCVGMKRCCRVGCSTQCLYPIRTTPCFHMALTAELYELRKVLRCDRGGKFERMQCDDNGCFCVDIDSGDEISGTRTSDSLPNCRAAHKCPDVVCRTSCPYEFERDANGCRSCRCKNPCATVKCHQGSYCVMAAVNCFQTENCPPQPRCVLNLCPRGEPFISQVGVVETCNSDEQCPSGHWCNQVGFSSTGLCCAMPAKAVHSGTCPPTAPLLHNLSVCGFECRSDDDCQITEKCCYDGCGLHCKAMTSDVSKSGEETKAELVKPGQCPYFDERSCEQPSQVNQCGTDDECAGVQKCCSDGCTKKCLYPENASACVQAKSALQMIGQSDRIQCRPAPRKCFIPLCTIKLECKYGMKKDSNGCDTCECSSPCDGVVCPDTSICVPMPVECISSTCPEVPRCVINPCLIGSPRLDMSTSQPVKCTDNTDCAGSNGSWYCSQYRSDNGVCCPGQEPRWSPGTCPPATTSNSDCSRRCLIDEQCSAGQRCCFNGCGLSCVAAGVHARLAALEIRESDSSIFVPECDSSGEYTSIQAHYGLKWCVDTSGREVPGTKTTHQPNCKAPRACPVRACSKHCPFGYRTDNDGCTVCDCIVPCELVQCQAGFICRMVQPRCYTKDCPPVARCLPNVCPAGEPLIAPGSDHLAECDEQRSCPAGTTTVINHLSTGAAHNKCCRCVRVRRRMPSSGRLSTVRVLFQRLWDELSVRDRSVFLGPRERKEKVEVAILAKSLSISSQPVIVGVQAVATRAPTMVKAVAEIAEPSRPAVEAKNVVTSSIDSHPFNVPVNRRPAISPVRSQKGQKSAVCPANTLHANTVFESMRMDVHIMVSVCAKIHVT